MNWVLNLLEDIKWKVQDFVWAVQDKVEMWKLDKEINNDTFDVEEIEVKPKKKKSKKKNVKKNKKSI